MLANHAAWLSQVTTTTEWTVAGDRSDGYLLTVDVDDMDDDQHFIVTVEDFRVAKFMQTDEEVDDDVTQVMVKVLSDQYDDAADSW